VTIGITDSYRPHAEQVDLARRKGLYSQGGLAAKQGTSDHGWGMAVDLDLNAKAQAWMRANGPSFGFHEDTPANSGTGASSPPPELTVRMIVSPVPVGLTLALTDFGSLTGSVGRTGTGLTCTHRTRRS
jgi:hypothetical protein